MYTWLGMLNDLFNAMSIVSEKSCYIATARRDEEKRLHAKLKLSSTSPKEV